MNLSAIVEAAPPQTSPIHELLPFVKERLVAIRDVLGTPEVLEATIATLESLAPDEVNKPALLAWLREGVELRDGRYEIRAALRALARAIQPRSYLEIGTRRGWSLAQVVAESSEVKVWSIDRWIADYGGVGNPGPEFVHSEICRVAPDFRGRVTYIDGNSHDTLPVLLDGWRNPNATLLEPLLARESENRPVRFDLVTVDGDHTAVGAWWDMVDVMPHVALGGAVVFDDLHDCSDERLGDRASALLPRTPAPADLRPSLLDVWHHVKSLYGNFVYIERLDSVPPIGIAVRIS